MTTRDHAESPPSSLAETVERETDPARKAELLIELAESLKLRDLAGSQQAAEQALALSREAERPNLAARALVLIGRAHWLQGRLAEAERLTEECVALATSVGELRVAQRATNVLGYIANEGGNPDRARHHFEHGLRIAEELGDPEAVAQACVSLGIFERERHEPARALGLFARALELQEGRSDRLGVAIIQTNFGATHGDLGDWEKALEYFYRALVEYEKLNNLRGIALSNINISEVYLKRGKYERTRQHAETAVRAAEAAALPLVRLKAQRRVGEACLLERDYPRAQAIFDDNIRLAREHQVPGEVAENMRDRADLLLAHQEPVAARRLLEQALLLIGPQGQPLARATILCSLARASALTGETEGARNYFEESVQTLEFLRENFELAGSKFAYGRFLVEQGERERGVKLVQDAARIFRQLEVIPDLSATERYLLRASSDADRRLPLLQALFFSPAPRALDEYAVHFLAILKDALGFREASLILRDVATVVLGEPCAEPALSRCLRDELVLNPNAFSLPLRIDRRVLGSCYLRAPLNPVGVGPDSTPSQLRVDPDPAFFSLLTRLLAVAVDYRRLVPPVELGGQNAESTAVRFAGMVGRSALMREVYDLIERVAEHPAGVLLRGESGTGKEVAARAIHQLSPRSGRPMVAINCAAIPESLLESELFGIERGVASGVGERIGKIEMADQSILFLDEVGDMSLSLQAKLLRFLDHHELERVGGRRLTRVDVQVIAATNRDLEQAIEDRAFRRDLYHRLNVVTITLPPLRERRDDIPLLVEHFLATFNVNHDRRIRGISPEALSVLRDDDWPGNVRELQNAIERAALLARTDIVQVEDLPSAVLQRRLSVQEPAPQTIDELREQQRKAERDAVKAREHDLVERALAENHGNVDAAADQLDISRTHLYRLIRKHQLKPKEYKSQPPGIGG